MGMGFGLPGFTEKYQVQEPEHIKTGDQCTAKRDNIYQQVVLIGFAQDQVLAEEAGKWRDSADGQGGGKEGQIGKGHLFTQSAHLADILLTTHRMDNTAGSQKE